jgi:hypothetical protein
MLTCTLAACGGVENPFEPELPIARLTILGGGGQAVALGDTLATPVTVRLEIDGVPATGHDVKFMVIADVSPGPNHTWLRTTDSNGMASGNGVIQNTGKGGAKIVVVYEVCMDPFYSPSGCTKFETAAAAETRITVN